MITTHVIVIRYKPMNQRLKSMVFKYKQFLTNMIHLFAGVEHLMAEKREND